MATEVARLTAVLEADTKRFERGINGARETTSRLDRQIGNTGITMRTVFAGAAGAAALDFMKGAVTEASNLNESINAVNVTFGESAEGILALGENAAESVGLANSEFNALAVTFSNFVETAVGEGGDVVGEMERLTTRVADFASVMNLDVPEAAQKFQSALAGETEAMRRFGIDVSAVAVEQKALELGLGDATGKLTEQEKVMARLAILYEETEEMAGDFANTSDDFANKQRRLTKRFQDAQAAIGEGLLPMLVNLMEAAEPLVSVIGTLGEAFSSFTEDSRELKEQGNPFEQLIGGLRGMFTTGALGFVVDQWDQLTSLWSDNEPEVRRFANGIGEMGKESKDMKNDVAGADRVLKQYADRLEDIGDEAKNAVPGVRELADAQAAVNNAAREAASPIFGAISALQRLEDAAEEGNTDFFEMAELTLDAQSAIAELGAGNVTAGIQAIADAMDVPIGQVAQMLEDLGILDSTTWSVNLLFDASMDSADRALLNSVRTVTGSGSGRITSVQEMIRGGLQHGGFAHAGQPYLVGEAGPELFVPNQSGTVVPNISLTQNFQRVAGDNIEADISRGILLSGIGRFIESSPR